MSQVRKNKSIVKYYVYVITQLAHKLTASLHVFSIAIYSKFGIAILQTCFNLAANLLVDR